MDFVAARFTRATTILNSFGGAEEMNISNIPAAI